MLSRLKKDVENGIRKLKWFSALLSERVRIEITVFKLLYKAEELGKKRDELLRRLGDEVYKIRGKEKNVYSNSEVIAAMKALESIEPEIKEAMEKASDISKLVT
jgi:hypothetical protein